MTQQGIKPNSLEPWMFVTNSSQWTSPIVQQPAATSKIWKTDWSSSAPVTTKKVPAPIAPPLKKVESPKKELLVAEGLMTTTTPKLNPLVFTDVSSPSKKNWEPSPAIVVHAPPATPAPAPAVVAVVPPPAPAPPVISLPPPAPVVSIPTTPLPISVPTTPLPTSVPPPSVPLSLPVPLPSSILPELDLKDEPKKNNIEEELARQSLYKTELCRSFAETGACRYGHRCQFAHGEHELRPVLRHPKYKTETCRSFYTTGSCRYGSRCRFIHAYPPVQQEWSTSWDPIANSKNTTNLLSSQLKALELEERDPKKVEDEIMAASRRLAIFEALAHAQANSS